MRVWRLEYSIEGKRGTRTVFAEGDSPSIAIFDAERRILVEKGRDALEAFQGTAHCHVCLVATLDDGTSFQEVSIPGPGTLGGPGGRPDTYEGPYDGD